VGGLKRTGEELRAEEGKVFMDGKDLGFCVKMVNGTHLHTAGGYAAVFGWRRWRRWGW